jgi:hypothetical protein
MIKTHGDAPAMLARLDAMVANVMDSPKVKPRTRDAFLYAQQTLARAWAVEQGRPQPLFDPNTHVGHPPAAQVKALSEPPDTVQMGMAFNGDNARAEVIAERGVVQDVVEDHIIRTVRDRGALTDSEIAYHYVWHGLLPAQSAAALRNARIELTRVGRLVKADTKRVGGKDVPLWDVVERAALT